MSIRKALIASAAVAFASTLTVAEASSCHRGHCQVSVRAVSSCGTSCAPVRRVTTSYSYRQVRVKTRRARSHYVTTPAQYATRNERVLVRRGHTERRYVPAVYRTRTERVLVRRGRTVRNYVPAVYGTRRRQVVIRRARHTSSYRPAVYRTEYRRVMVRSARTRWVRRPSRYKTVYTTRRTCGYTKVTYRRNNCTGCVTKCSTRVAGKTYRVARRIRVSGGSYAVRTPAVYRDVARRVMVRRARRVSHYVPAVYGTRSERVIIRRARHTTSYRPAVYSHRTRRVLVRSARSYAVRTPAVYSWRARTVKVRSARSHKVYTPAEYGYKTVRVAHRTRCGGASACGGTVRRVAYRSASRGCGVRRSVRRNRCR